MKIWPYMTQKEAITILTTPDFGYHLKDGEVEQCSGVTETCPNEECPICALRDCPHGAPEHHWHDGCPVCWGGDKAQ